jgi:tetratricopeptide (TPR) repeat protein
MDTVAPFRAFVSYCHADRAFAARLQRRLETYRLPKRLAGEVAPLPGQAPGRIGPIFRDRADLSAAEDLSAAVREAIAVSSALVVVASPDAAKSHWVAREIALFRDLHPQAPILVALARGEPAEAMPEALRASGTEPLAADFRKEGDGSRLAFLKVVAGLAHLPLDALVRRDAQRQLRRVTAVTLGAAVLVVVMALLLVMMVRAREEAERRRVAAEGVVEAMVTDVRKEARRTGNLKLRAAINDLALSYYSKQGDLDSLPDESLERRARVLHALGEDDETLGKYAAALGKFNEAHKATARILARRPEDPDAIFAHGQSEYWLGSVAFFSNDQDRALAHWRAYFDLAQTLSRAEPARVRSKMELAYAHGDLCDVDMRDGRNVSAGIEHCRAAIALERSALASHPSDEGILRALANRLGWFADALFTQKQFAEARMHREEEEAIIASLLQRDAADAELRDRATWPQIGLAKIDIAEAKLEQGLARYRRCLGSLDRLSAEYPDNQLVLGERIRVHILLAAALRKAGRPDWRTHRDRAETLLYPSGDNRPPPGLERQHKMFVKLEQGDKP